MDQTKDGPKEERKKEPRGLSASQFARRISGRWLEYVTQKPPSKVDLHRQDVAARKPKAKLPKPRPSLFRKVKDNANRGGGK